VCRTKRACRHSVAVRTRDQGQHWQHPLICSAVTQRRAVLGTPGDRGRLVPFAYDPSKQALQIHGWSETARCSVHGRMSEAEWCTRRGLLQATTTWLSALERADPGPQRRAQRTKRTSGVRDKAPGIHRSPDRLWTPRTARHSWADMRQLKRRGTLSRGGLTIFRRSCVYTVHPRTGVPGIQNTTRTPSLSLGVRDSVTPSRPRTRFKACPARPPRPGARALAGRPIRETELVRNPFYVRSKDRSDVT